VFSPWDDYWENNPHLLPQNAGEGFSREFLREYVLDFVSKLKSAEMSEIINECVSLTGCYEITARNVVSDLVAGGMLNRAGSFIMLPLRLIFNAETVSWPYKTSPF
jgi:hypothetical protein